MSGGDTSYNLDVASVNLNERASRLEYEGRSANGGRIGSLHQPDVAWTDREMDAGGGWPALYSGNPRIREHELARISGDQPDGQGPGGAARRYDRHRGGGDLRLSRGRLSRSRFGAAAWLAPARTVLSLALLRRGTDRSGQHQQGPQDRCAGGAH